MSVYGHTVCIVLFYENACIQIPYPTALNIEKNISCKKNIVKNYASSNASFNIIYYRDGDGELFRDLMIILNLN